MRTAIKKIFNLLPVNVRRIILRSYEKKYAGKNISFKKELEKDGNTGVKNILFYHVSGLSFGGTEKFLQIIAKHINPKKYRVFFMYSPQARSSSSSNWAGRKKYLENIGITFVPFSYDSMSKKYPYEVKNMRPSFAEIIEKEKIDLVVTAGSGYSEYPFNQISSPLIILINIFGSPNTQPNIVNNICISHAVAEKIRPIVPEAKISIMYILSEGPDSDAITRGKNIRTQYGIKETDTVFGRIGRADNAIFDEIGIRAFQKIIKTDSSAHYFIMSPPPVLIEIVEKENIPNVHFLAQSSDEKDIWAFHASLDALAHFRKDGESCGLNIAESMLSGKPVISHRSAQWNAHAEYLEPEFSRIAEINNADQYADYLREFIALKKTGQLENMGKSAKAKAERIFLVTNNIARIETWIDSALK